MMDACRLRAVVLICAAQSISGAFALGASVAGPGIVVDSGGDIGVGRDFTIGLGERQIQELAQGLIGFRARYQNQLETIGRQAKLDPCGAEELLQKLALKDFSTDAPPGALTESIRGYIKVVAGRDIKVGRDLILGIPRDSFLKILKEMRTQDSGQFELLKRLSTDLNVTSCATTSFLKRLGEEQVPAGQLQTRLERIAAEFLEVKNTFQSLTTRDPKIKALRSRADTALDRGDIAAAKDLLRQALRIMEDKKRMTRQMDVDFAKVQGSLGNLEMIGLNYDEAAKAFEQAHQYATDTHDQAAAIRYKAQEAAAYQDSGRYREAKEAFIVALDTDRNPPPADGSAGTLAIKIRINQATLYYALSEYLNAKRQYQEAYDELGSLPGLDAKKRAESQALCLNGLAESAIALNDFVGADAYFGRALSLMARTFGADAPQLARLVANLARLRAAQAQYPAAEALYRRALALTASAPADAQQKYAAPLERAAVINNLAALYFNTRRDDKAEELWNEALPIYRDALGPKHFVTLAVYQNLAALKRRQGDLAGAEAQYREALSAWKGEKADTDRDTTHLVRVTLLDGLGDVYVSQGHLDEAQGKYEQALKLLRLNLDKQEEDTSDEDVRQTQPSLFEQHLLMADLNQDLGVVYAEKMEYEQAKTHLEKALEIYKLKLRDKHPKQGTAASNLADVLLRLGRPEQAEPLYLAAIEIAAANNDPLRAADRSRKLAALYRGQGHIDQARERLETARAIYARQVGAGAAQTRAVANDIADLGQHADH